MLFARSVIASTDDDDVSILYEPKWKRRARVGVPCVRRDEVFRDQTVLARVAVTHPGRCMKLGGRGCSTGKLDIAGARATDYGRSSRRRSIIAGRTRRSVSITLARDGGNTARVTYPCFWRCGGAAGPIRPSSRIAGRIS